MRALTILLGLYHDLDRVLVLLNANAKMAKAMMVELEKEPDEWPSADDYEKIRHALSYILPMAKGYAAEHDVGANQEKVEGAEEALAESWADPTGDAPAVHDDVLVYAIQASGQLEPSKEKDMAPAFGLPAEAYCAFSAMDIRITQHTKWIEGLEDQVGLRLNSLESKMTAILSLARPEFRSRFKDDADVSAEDGFTGSRLDAVMRSGDL